MAEVYLNCVAWDAMGGVESDLGIVMMVRPGLALEGVLGGLMLRRLVEGILGLLRV